MPKSVFKIVKNFFAWYFAIWILSALVSLALFAGVVWVAIHFISKFW